MRKSLLRKQEKEMLVAMDRQLREIHQMVPEIRDLLQLRTVLDALGPHIATLDALGPHIATLDALGPRLALIDSVSVAINDVSNIARQMGTVNDIALFADLIQRLNPIVEKYLEQNHLVAENVRVDVETVVVMLTALQMQISQLQKIVEETRQR